MLSKLKALAVGGVAVFAGALFNQEANAAWYWNLASATDVAAIHHNGDQRTIELAQGTSGARIFDAVKYTRNNLYLQLRTQLENQVGAQLRSQPDYRSHETWVRGALQMSLTPAGGGRSTVSMSGLSAGVKAHFKFKKMLIVFDCDIAVDTGPMAIQASLDLANGLITPSLPSFSPSYSRNCDSSISWVPGIGSLVENLAESKIDDFMQETMRQGMAGSQGSFQPIQFAGLNLALPDGKWVFNGFDAGNYLRTNLAGLIANTAVTVRLDEPSDFELNGRLAYGGDLERTIDNGVLWISFPNNNLAFGLIERKRYQTIWYCPIPSQCGHIDN